MSIWDEKFRGWARPPSESEESRISAAERAVRSAVSSSSALSHRSIRVFVQGSYRNNVNVKQNSDIDIGILCSDTFFWTAPDGLTREMLNISPATYSYPDFRKDVESALRGHFGAGEVTAGRKAFDIKSNSYRIEADVAPFFEHRRYDSNGGYLSGVEMNPPAITGSIVNWPDQHYENGVQKNSDTQRRYKSIVRVMKKLAVEMDGCPSPLNLSQIDLSDFGGSGRIEDGSEAVFG